MGTFNTKTRNLELYKALGLLDNSLIEDSPTKNPQIVSLIGSVLERNIQRNEKVLKKTRTKDGVTMFHGSKVPTLNIRQYLERVFKYSKCSTSCFVVAYIYMDRFIRATNCYLTSLNAHRLLIACVLVATKLLEDELQQNAYFGKVGGVSVTEMNKLEVKLLCSLDYRLNVPLEMFDQYCVQLEKIGADSEKRTCHMNLNAVLSLVGIPVEPYSLANTNVKIVPKIWDASKYWR